MAKKKKGDPGTGCVYQRGKTWWIGYRHRGKLSQESSKSKKKMVAVELLKQRLGEIQKRGAPGVRYEKVTFEDLMELIIVDYEDKGQKRPRVTHLEGTFKDYLAMEITSTEIKKFVHKRMAEQAANATINQDLKALRRMFNLAKKNTPPLLRDVPHIELLPENNVKTNFFEDILFEEHNKALPDYLTGFALFGKLTGWRENEVAGLTWDRVDLDRRTVRLNPEHTKNKQIRNMYMEDELVVLMIEQEQMKRKGCPYVFHCNGKRLSVGGVKGCKDIRFDWNRSFRESSAGYGYCTSPTYRGKWEAEGLTAGPTFHDLRRTAAREMDDASLSRKQIRLRGGWKTDSMFDRYNIGTEKDTERAADKLSKHRNGAGDYNPDYNLPPESENYTLVVPQDPEKKRLLAVVIAKNPNIKAFLKVEV